MNSLPYLILMKQNFDKLSMLLAYLSGFVEGRRITLPTTLANPPLKFINC